MTYNFCQPSIEKNVTQQNKKMSFPRSPGGNPGTFMVGHPDAFNNPGSPTEKIGDDQKEWIPDRKNRG